MFVYKIENKFNGKCYIGASTQNDIKNRWGEHIYSLNRNKHTNSLLQNDWNKYGENNFDFTVLNEFPSDFNRKELAKIEIKTIELYDSFNNGYNMTIGGEIPNPKTFLKYEQEIIKCGKLSNGKTIYGLKRDGEVVLTSINRAEIFLAFFNLDYSNK